MGATTQPPGEGHLASDKDVVRPSDQFEIFPNFLAARGGIHPPVWKPDATFSSRADI
jgi:hypothetical protein